MIVGAGKKPYLMSTAAPSGAAEWSACTDSKACPMCGRAFTYGIEVVTYGIARICQPIPILRAAKARAIGISTY
jgi:hypothetical protein